MKQDARIFVAGHRGMVGGAIVRNLESKGYTNLLKRTRAELDLRDQGAVNAFFAEEKPEYVVIAAAKVGGIHANNTYPAEFIHENLAIQTNLIHAAYTHGVERLLFLGSSCIYPKDAPQPIKEEYLLTGPLEPTNRPYAVAKIAGIEMCWAYNRQYGTKYLAAMPTNLYGPGDNYHPENSHVIPGLIRRFVEAAKAGKEEVVCWGSGTPRREFLHCDDLAEGCVHLLTLDDERYLPLCRSKVQPPLINIGSGSDVTIRELAEMVAKAAGFTGRIVWDASKPDGTMRKLMNSRAIVSTSWRPHTSLREGLAAATRLYAANDAPHDVADGERE
jgi:GDP-L-fucose synthase